ncbi:MAG TPA: sugar phosphate nucleotidyltransferase [Bacilli bacterium]
MKLVLLSGGSGKRLWPLSNDSRSKQFLQVLRNESGDMESMVQRVWRQLRKCGLQRHAVIATGKGQVDMIRGQLGGAAPLVVEPERRDTFPAIALAAAYLYSIAGVSLQETVVVLPVDPYVEDAFFLMLHALDEALRHSKADLALIGVKPTHPAEKYGYIIPKKVKSGAGTAGYLPIRMFKEKPDCRLAAKLIAQGALWNCGVFAFRLAFLINHLERRGIPLSFEALARKYDALPKNSFDYEIVEKTAARIVIPYAGTWKDLGTWNTLTEEMETRALGNAWIGEAADNSHVVNELGIPVALIGIRNAVVAASHDGILVADKAYSHQIKTLLGHFDQRPVYAEWMWGSRKVLDVRKCADGSEMQVELVSVNAGCRFGDHVRLKYHETWTILSGEGTIMLDESEFRVKPGDTFCIKAGVRHALRADTRLELIVVQHGNESDRNNLVELMDECL